MFMSLDTFTKGISVLSPPSHDPGDILDKFLLLQSERLHFQQAQTSLNILGGLDNKNWAFSNGFLTPLLPRNPRRVSASTWVAERILGV